MKSGLHDPDRYLRWLEGQWKVRYYIDKTRQRTIALKTTKLAEARILRNKIMAKVLAERQGHKVVEPEAEKPKRITWEDVQAAYFATPRWKQRSENTQKRYLIDLRRIGRFLEEAACFPEEIDITTVTAFVAEMADEDPPLRPQTMRNALTAFSRAMSAAIGIGYVKHNPVAEYERNQLGKNARINPPLNGEFERILPEVGEYNENLALFVDFLHRTGCRVGEALMARAEDILDGGHQLHLSRAVKGDRGRTIYLNAAEELLPRLSRKGRLFSLPASVPGVSSMWGTFWRERTEREMQQVEKARAVMPPRTPAHLMPEPDAWQVRRWRLHDHRHSFAINSIVAGADLWLLSRHLGHQSVRMTEWYLKEIDRLPIARRPGLRLPGHLRGLVPGKITGDEEQPDVPDQVRGPPTRG